MTTTLTTMERDLESLAGDLSAQFQALAREHFRNRCDEMVAAAVDCENQLDAAIGACLRRNADCCADADPYTCPAVGMAKLQADVAIQMVAVYLIAEGKFTWDDDQAALDAAETAVFDAAAEAYALKEARR
jgi:hypothetical protein